MNGAAAAPVFPEPAGIIASRQAKPAMGERDTLIAKLPEDTSTPETTFLDCVSPTV